MSYQTLAVKHRPTKFSQVVGQKVAVKTLVGMITTGRVPSTILICGPRSSGKTTLSRILATTLNCANPTEKGPCGQCRSCKETHHPDIQELNASSDRGIDMVRRLERNCRLSPMYKKRVFLIEEVHATTPQAHQAFLLTLEEPPPTCQFVLITTDPQKLPDTVLARCSRVSLQAPPIKSMVKWLIKLSAKEGLELSNDQALQICQASGQHPREALTLLEQLLCYANGEVLTDKTVKTCVDRVTGGNWKTNCDLVKAVLLNDQTTIAKQLALVDNHNWALSSCTELLDNIWRSKITKERRWRNFDLAKYDLQHVAHAFKTFATWQAQASTYALAPKICLDLAILEAIGTN